MTEPTPPGNNPPPPSGGVPQGPPPGVPQGSPPGVPQGPPPGVPQYGSYPPPANYPPPPGAPSGGYPPPPSAAGGYAPPPPGYGAPAPFSVGDAFSWAWNKFTKNAGALIVPALAYGAILGVLGLLFFVLPSAAMMPDSDDYYYGQEPSMSFGVLFIWFIGFFVLLVASGAMSSAYLGGVLDIADGKPVTIGTFFKPRNLGAVIVAALLVGLASFVGSLVILGAAVVSIFSLFVAVAVVDRNLSAVDGIKVSFDLVKDRFGDSILVWLLFSVIVTVSVMLCGVGILVGGPVALLFLAYSWRRLSGGPVAALTP